MSEQLLRVVLDGPESYEALENAQRHGCQLQICSVGHEERWQDFPNDIQTDLRAFPPTRYRAVAICAPAPPLCEDEGCPHHGTPHACVPHDTREAQARVLDEFYLDVFTEDYPTPVAQWTANLIGAKCKAKAKQTREENSHDETGPTPEAHELAYTARHRPAVLAHPERRRRAVHGPLLAFQRQLAVQQLDGVRS